MPRPSRKVILFEMNEVPYRVIDDFAASHPKSEMAQILGRSKQFETICEDQIELDPWISWPTLHRGVIDQQHRILHLGQSLEWANSEYPPVWELLARNGRPVGVFGSLHSSAVPRDARDYRFYVPDFFADETFAHPRELEAFQRFNLVMTRRSARNVDNQIPLGAALAFLRRYISNGMTWSTARTALAALYAERRQPHLKCRRRSIQPLFGLDMFLHLMRKTRPDFASFYTNHVAANMHRFWAAAFPDDLSDNPMPMSWRREYEHEIAYSMEVLDDMTGRLKTLADESDYLLVIASSLGQSAIRAKETPGFVTITDLQRFMRRLGLSDNDWKEKYGMVPCVSVLIDPAKASAFEHNLQSIAVGEHRMRKEQREIPPLSYDTSGDGSFQLFVYFEAYTGAETATLSGAPLPFEELGLGFFQHEEKVACSGRHTPFGSLIVYDPRMPAISSRRSAVSSLGIAPALLLNFGIQPPDYMVAPDPDLLDVSKASPSVNISDYGGGVETPVTRARRLDPVADSRSLAAH